MVIRTIEFPIYLIMLLLSLIIASFNLYLELKNNTKKEYIFYYIFLFLIYTSFGGYFISYKYSEIVNTKLELFSYSAAVCALINSLTFEIIIPNKEKKFLKAMLISMPLSYSIAKIGCFLTGCCYGIEYYGIFSVTYSNNLNISYFPIQLIESIIFFILFIVLKKLKNNKYFIYISVISACSLKFILDYFRYESLNKVITRNQILSLVFIFITIIVYFINKKR